MYVIDRRTLVFSAHAEVVPASTAGCSSARGILRARGGSSALANGEAFRNQYSPRTRR